MTVYQIKKRYSSNGTYKFYTQPCKVKELFRTFGSFKDFIHFMLSDMWLFRDMAEMVCYQRNLGMK